MPLPVFVYFPVAGCEGTDSVSISVPERGYTIELVAWPPDIFPVDERFWKTHY